MKKTLLSAAMILALSLQSNPTAAKVHYVKAGATGDGSSWESAAGDLDAMLDEANTGDEIWIAAGTYKPTRLIRSSKKNSRTFTLKDGVALYGGFKGTETSKDERELAASGKPYDFKNETILSGDDDIADRWVRAMMDASTYRYGWETEDGLIPGTADNSNHILYTSTELTHPTIINGLTLKGGNAMVWNVKAAGAALYALGNIQMSGCKITENSAYFTAESSTSSDTKGGAVYIIGSGDASITNCYFTRNYSHSKYGNGLGGAIYASKTTISNCQFEDCVALDAGGAVYNVDGTVSDCQFSNCYASQGGAVSNGGTIRNSTIFDCRGLLGGGLFNAGKAYDVTVANCYADTEEYGSDLGGQGGGIYNYMGEVSGAIVYNNTSFKGGGIFIRGGKVSNCTVQNNAVREGTDDADLGFYEGSNAADNVANTVYGPVPADNFTQPTNFDGIATTDQEAEAIHNASWALAPGSSLSGQGYEASTNSISRKESHTSTEQTAYFTLDGMCTQPARAGIYVKQIRRSDGTVSTSKVIIR
ncbi:MAG: right-handed parallel beta-helix repeat-containing protein [Prevotella sp.]|nr:right-handed parallel beta-helix repeat-containing protein [Prevotella sp.]